MNPTLKAVHAPRNTLNSAERNLYPPIARRDVLASQLLKLSEHDSNLQEEFAELQAEVLSMFSTFVTDSDTMRENKQIYADLEKLSLEYERTKFATLSPAEKQQHAQYTPQVKLLM